MQFIPRSFLRGIFVVSFTSALSLASLVKGEVLSPEKIRATTGGIAFLPHPFRFSDTSVNNPSIVSSASHCNRSSPLHKGAKGDSALPTIPKPHYPLALHQHPCLPSKKGRWHGCRVFSLAVQYSNSPAFTILKLFRAVTEGIVNT